MGFSRQEYWSGLPFPTPGDLPDPGIKPSSPTRQLGEPTAQEVEEERPVVGRRIDQERVPGDVRGGVGRGQQLGDLAMAFGPARAVEHGDAVLAGERRELRR